jgi:ABC-type transporter Mla MlaB component
MAVPAPQTIAFAVRGPIARSDLPGLCDRVCELFGRTHPQVALCDVSTVDPDAVTVDALARLQLAARRYACQVRLRDASDDLLELVSFMGLTDVLPDQPKEEEWRRQRPERSS